MNNPPRNELRGFGSWEPPTSAALGTIGPKGLPLQIDASPRNELRGSNSWEPPTRSASSGQASAGGVGYTMACETTL